MQGLGYDSANEVYKLYTANGKEQQQKADSGSHKLYTAKTAEIKSRKQTVELTQWRKQGNYS
jgi:hypothetical protein